jgi:hypothetical protein
MDQIQIFEGGSELYAAGEPDEAIGPDGVEIIHWYDEPTDWITTEETGADPKEYWHKWQDRNRDLEKQLEILNAHLHEGGLNYNMFKWQMRDIKDTVRVMRAISNLVENTVREMKTRKILGAPQEKFYARCTTGAGAVAFVVGIVSSALDLISVDSLPSWLSLFWFLLATGFTWLSATLAERWGGRERKIRKMQRITERKGIIEHAKAMIDILDFDEVMLKKIAGRSSVRRRSRKISASDRNEIEIVRDLRRKDALLRELPTEMRRRIPADALRNELERRKVLRHGLETEISQNRIDSHLEALRRTGPKRWRARSDNHSDNHPEHKNKSRSREESKRGRKSKELHTQSSESHSSSY